MNQAERRYFLIKELLKEHPRYGQMEIPEDTRGQKRLLRSLMNVRMPGPAGREFLGVQDAYLQEETAKKGIVDWKGFEPAAEGIYLWQGDITTLRCDAIVNAANSGMTGCYVPCHGCIDNCIHTFSGVQLRLACAEMMERLASCYRSCLALADENQLESIAFCCISTGEFHFPNDKAAKIAVQTVKAYKKETRSKIEVIFNVFKEIDHEIYKKLLIRN